MQLIRFHKNCKYQLSVFPVIQQSLLDVCYDNGTDNDILFNPIKSVCTVFKPKAYKLYLNPTVFIGQETLKYILNLNIYDLASVKFSPTPDAGHSKCDDCDMLRQMRSLYANSKKLIRTFSHFVC